MNRKETIKWLESLKAEIGKSEHISLWHYAEALDMAIEALKDRPKGHWKMFDIYDFKGRISGERAIICDRCLMKEIIRFGQSKWNFCPNCGAYMKGEDE